MQARQVAVQGTACSRSFGMSLPQRSQPPYEPVAIFMRAWSMASISASCVHPSDRATESWFLSALVLQIQIPRPSQATADHLRSAPPDERACNPCKGSIVSFLLPLMPVSRLTFSCQMSKWDAKDILNSRNEGVAAFSSSSRLGVECLHSTRSTCALLRNSFIFRQV